MALYKTTTEIFEAIQFKGSSTDCGDIERWMKTGNYQESQIKTQDIRSATWILSSDEKIHAFPGDYVIKASDGKFYSIDRELFQSIFKELSND